MGPPVSPRTGHAGPAPLPRRINRAPSTVSRELRRNAATRDGRLEYRVSIAQRKAERAARRPKPAELVVDDRLRGYVQDRLAEQVSRPDGTPVPGPATAAWKGRNKPRRQDRRWATAWSPEQIAHRLPIDFPDDGSMRISHEAINQAFYVHGRGALTRELVTCLGTGGYGAQAMREALAIEGHRDAAGHGADGPRHERGAGPVPGTQQDPPEPAVQPRAGGRDSRRRGGRHPRRHPGGPGGPADRGPRRCAGRPESQRLCRGGNRSTGSSGRGWRRPSPLRWVPAPTAVDRRTIGRRSLAGSPSRPRAR